VDVVTELCEKLVAGGAPGLHFYTLNQANTISTIIQRLDIK
jgi:methylenetetrahydrofolate reductase (NADPH)